MRLFDFHLNWRIQKTKNWILGIISLVCIWFLIILVTGCLIKQSEGNPVIMRMQKDVPFTIIVPTYFPGGIRSVPSVISGPSSDDILNAVYIEIEYGYNPEKMIILNEENHYSNLVPTNSYNIFNIKGVEITVEETSSASASKTYNGLLYEWNSNGVNFQVRIFGYEQNEGQKVVESMVN